MCGIIGYVGKKQALPILLDGLRRMEYRGYDSAGVATVEADSIIHTTKQPGHLKELEAKIKESDHKGSVGIGHIRWATHGVPNEMNAHPHWDCTRTIFLAHNGIIENHAPLRKNLAALGHIIASDTDTEIIAHLVETATRSGEKLEHAVLTSLKQITGTYGLIVLSSREPDTMVAARLGSPLILGIIGPGEYIIASDVAAIVSMTREVVYLEEGDVITVSPADYHIASSRGTGVTRPSQQVEWDMGQIEKNGYPHFMLKEIFEQPESMRNSMRGRVVPSDGYVRLGGLHSVEQQLQHIKRITIVACGTALHAGLIGEYWIEQLADIPVEVEMASEFRYRAFPADEGTAVLFISQSGETADTIAALREAKRRGFLTLGIVNVVGSTIARETDAGIYNHAGPEIAVASTKAFTSQLIVLLLLALKLGRQRNLSQADTKKIVDVLVTIPEQIRTILATHEQITSVAEKYATAQDVLYIGRQLSFPVALEGALKLKEISYVHAEGYAAGELKHGPIALIEPSIPTVAVIPHDAVYEKTLSNLQEIKARKGKIVAITDTHDEHLEKLADDVIIVPQTLEILSPILTIIPLQIFAYAIAITKGLDVDKPRNLAKSVTVE